MADRAQVNLASLGGWLALSGLLGRCHRCSCCVQGIYQIVQCIPFLHHLNAQQPGEVLAHALLIAKLSGDGVDLTCQLAVLDAKMLRQMLLS
jgi:hypothetical protein